jgi:hypothetical protein
MFSFLLGENLPMTMIFFGEVNKGGFLLLLVCLDWPFLSKMDCVYPYYQFVSF